VSTPVVPAHPIFEEVLEMPGLRYIAAALGWCALASGVATSDAGAVSASGVIAFASNRDGDAEIYAMSPNGTGVRRLTHSRKYDSPSAWSLDRRRLLFYSQRTPSGDVWIMNADGSGQRNLTLSPAHDGGGSWSRDGKMIAFDSDRAGAGDVYVMKADGSGTRKLTDDPRNDTQPAWSPDGTAIAFVSERDGPSEIFVMSPDGTGQHGLTSGAKESLPVWSPNGQTLAFVRVAGGKASIYVMNKDGSGQRLVIRDTNNWISGLSFSPDGRRLAFSSGRDQPAGELYLVNVNGGGLVRLTRNRFGDNDPVWSR
jgi:Tol biopolymer transport system component